MALLKYVLTFILLTKVNAMSFLGNRVNVFHKATLSIGKCYAASVSSKMYGLGLRKCTCYDISCGGHYVMYAAFSYAHFLDYIV